RASVSAGQPSSSSRSIQSDRAWPGKRWGMAGPYPGSATQNAQRGAHAAALVVGHRAHELVATGAAQREAQRRPLAGPDDGVQAADPPPGAADDEVVVVLAQVADVELQRAGAHATAVDRYGELELAGADRTGG